MAFIVGIIENLVDVLPSFKAPVIGFSDPQRVLARIQAVVLTKSWASLVSLAVKLSNVSITSPMQLLI